MLNEVKTQISNVVKSALESALAHGQLMLDEIPDIQLEPPKLEIHGDIACPLPLSLAKQAKMPPYQIAERIATHIDVEQETLIDKIEIVKPGFINFFLSTTWLYDLLRRIHAHGGEFGKCPNSCEFGYNSKQRIQVEFVSANPTGPLNVVNGRAASVGDTIVNLLNAVGYKAEREYYINDAGEQTYALARSIDARYRELLGEKDVSFPENGYPGEYVIELAQRLIDRDDARYLDMSESERLEAFRRFGCTEIAAEQKKDLERFGVFYDVWMNERAIRDTGKPAEIIKMFDEKGYLYESDKPTGEKSGFESMTGIATWFKSTEFGDKEDRVLVKSNGNFTYIVPDIAYHYNKFTRGFDRVIDLWGPDHHGQIGLMKAAIKALGFGDDQLDILIVQQVNIIEKGETKKMSKRKGQYYTLRQLIDELAKNVDERFAVDVARYFFLMRSTNAKLDFDINLAITQADENPVFYVQYAHARICSIFRQMAERGITQQPIDNLQLDMMTSDEEVRLMKKLADFPEIVLNSAQKIEPHHIPHYLQEVASLFHAFYGKHRVLDAVEPELTQARLVLIDCVRTVLRNGLTLLGITAPETM
ncbi:MAG: arginine--tRNA ligase [Deltaproteobacteria bacterium]|nr:arginine--tRNA ligase [Deltaproteobacteria bacterium]